MESGKSQSDSLLSPHPRPSWRDKGQKAARWAVIFLASATLVKSMVDLGAREKFQGLSDSDSDSASDPNTNTAKPFSWDNIQPSESLEYHNCGDGFQCARLEVPMDYENPDPGSRKFALAVAKLPARVPVSDPRYGGAVLINPGKLSLRWMS